MDSSSERLIDEAGRIFAAKGDSATVREICKAAGCSVAAINYHFGDKRQLYIRCVQEALECKQRLFPLPKAMIGSDERPSESEAVELLRLFLRGAVKRIVGRSEEADLTWHNILLLREVIAPSPEVSELLREPFRNDFLELDNTLNILLADLSSQNLRRRLAKQILAQCMFMKTGGALCELVGLGFLDPQNTDPYADEILESILLQIEAMRHAKRLPPLALPTPNYLSQIQTPTSSEVPLEGQS